MDSRLLNVIVKGDSMWPTLVDGSTVRFEKIEDKPLEVGQIVLAKHPLHSNLLIIKRIQSINENKIFLVGDNPDSHNFGSIEFSQVTAIISEN
jgi:nickel-type superoxide dismutase maturation protease